MSTASAAPAKDPVRAIPRIASLDQFRGYTVIGMVLVNFFGGYAVCPYVLRHTHEYNSYADTIMPQFLFAVGFAFRLTFGRRLELMGATAAYSRVIRRMLGLILVSMVVYGVGRRAPDWETLKEIGILGALYEPLKRGWYQTLVHIAVTGLWLVPVIRASTSVRVLWIVGSALAHMLLSHWFNYAWENGQWEPQWWVELAKAHEFLPKSINGIDGGPLGFLTWVIPAGIGTLACDAIAVTGRKPNLVKMTGWAFILMAGAWVLSCGTRFYDVPADQVESLKEQRLSPNPVFPPWSVVKAKLTSGHLSDLLAEPPFVPPPHSKEWEPLLHKDTKEPVKNKRTGEVVMKEVNHSTWYRKWNYWSMSQRSGTITYTTFSAGFSLLVYVLFYVACDIYHLQVPVFRTFGTNALLGYILHGMVGDAVQSFAPRDAPAWYAIGALLTTFAVTWLFLRSLEKQGVYLRV